MITLVIEHKKGTNILKTLVNFFNQNMPDQVIIFSEESDNILNILEKENCCGEFKPLEKTFDDIKYTEVIFKTTINIFKNITNIQALNVLKNISSKFVFFTSSNIILKNDVTSKYIDIMQNEDVLCVYSDYIEVDKKIFLPVMSHNYREQTHYFMCKANPLKLISEINSYKNIPEYLFHYGIVESVAEFDGLYQ